MRSLEELVDPADPSFPLIEEWVADASTDVTVLPVERRAAEATLLALQVTTRSGLGGLAFHTGGILVDGGWLRVLGGGSPGMARSLASWNQIGAPQVRMPGAMLVGDDVLGGFFAIDGGAFGNRDGKVWYMAPDTLEWECMDVGHMDWVHWALTADVAGFYESMRWPGWEDEVATLGGDQVISVAPPLWAQGVAIGERSRRAVPLEELWHLQLDLRRQLAQGGAAKA
ncbi:MAG: DUF2625 domain-containing protein [Deltaproteobacteria bacterium]|nr:DUF2625 domain-containing protein [Kofleriaceae bacterium]